MVEDNNGDHTHIVGTKKPNELGIYDMSGNVWGWREDWYGDYKSKAQTDPEGPSTGSYRVLRSGSWYRRARLCRVSNRDDLSGVPQLLQRLPGGVASFVLRTNFPLFRSKFRLSSG